MISEITGGVTAAKGFRAASCAAGIKYQGRTDMAMIACSVPCAVAGTFTSNQVKAAPVLAPPVSLARTSRLTGFPPAWI